MIRPGLFFLFTCLAVIGLMSACTNQKQALPPKPLSQKVPAEITEEQIAQQTQSKNIDIGANPKEILRNLRKAQTQEDILQYCRSHRSVQKLDFGAFLVTEWFWTKNDIWHSLRYIIYNDSIKYGSVNSMVFKVGQPIAFKNDTAFINNYLSKHNAFYKTRKTRQDFIKELTEQDEPIIFFGGDPGSAFGTREVNLFKAVKGNDYDFVWNLLTSLHPENQALGIMGMEKLISKEVSVDPSCEKIIEHLKARNSSVNYWITCVSGTQKLKRFLMGYHWDKFFDLDIQSVTYLKNYEGQRCVVEFFSNKGPYNYHQPKPVKHYIQLPIL